MAFFSVLFPDADISCIRYLSFSLSKLIHITTQYGIDPLDLDDHIKLNIIFMNGRFP